MSEIKAVHIPTLMELLTLGARERPISLSTFELARRLGKSQQAVSKHLLELERNGYLERVSRGGKSSVKLTEKGLHALLELSSTLKRALEGQPSAYIFRGRLFTGLREGAYYVSLKGYRRQFIKNLGFDPYPGTFNIKLLTPMDIELNRELRQREGIYIEGFEDAQRTYGPAKCYPATVNGNIEGAVIAAVRTHYDASVLEVLAPVNLRSVLKLKDDDVISVEVKLPPTS